MCRTIQSRNNSKQENKWHAELNSILSVPFWDACHFFVDRIRNNNEIKYFQYLIIRNSLKTNSIVSHFVAVVPETCSFGCQVPETISHLFWHCQISTAFWSDLTNFVTNTLHLPIVFTRNEVLFGDHHQLVDSIKNTVMLIGKRFIWMSKFRHLNPTLLNFVKYLLQYLDTQKMIYTIKGSVNLFDDQWGNTVNRLTDFLAENEPPRAEDTSQ